MKMRIGRNEKILLLYLLQCKDHKAGIKYAHSLFTYRLIENYGDYISSSQLSQSFASLHKKGLVKRYARQGLRGHSTLTDRGITLATKYKEEIEEYIKLWGSLLQKPIESLPRK